MTDLTKIEKPFGLLDAETQAALKAHGGPWEYFNGTWLDAAPSWVEFPILGRAYRVKSVHPRFRGDYTVDPKTHFIWLDHVDGLVHVKKVIE